MKTYLNRLVLLAILIVGLAACSPEAERTRGGGPGADPGNRNATVEIHKGAEMFHETPQRTPGELTMGDEARSPEVTGAFDPERSQ